MFNVENNPAATTTISEPLVRRVRRHYPATTLKLNSTPSKRGSGVFVCGFLQVFVF